MNFKFYTPKIVTDQLPNESKFQIPPISNTTDSKKNSPFPNHPFPSAQNLRNSEKSLPNIKNAREARPGRPPNVNSPRKRGTRNAKDQPLSSRNRREIYLPLPRLVNHFISARLRRGEKRGGKRAATTAFSALSRDTFLRTSPGMRPIPAMSHRRTRDVGENAARVTQLYLPRPVLPEKTSLSKLWLSCNDGSFRERGNPPWNIMPEKVIS